MSDIIRIVHLSDFHWKKNNESTFSKQLFEPLLKSLNKENSERKIDLICITGDLLDKGNSGFEKASDAFSEFEKEVISKIITKLNFEKKNIILCPGNHDMDTKQDQDFADVGLEGKLTTQETVLKYMENIRENKFKDGIKRILPFKDFEKQFYQNKTETEISYFESIHRRTINGTTIGIVALNSAWRYYNHEDKENNIIIGRTQLTNALSKLENCSINILLSHYNTENFATFERKDLEHTISENYQIQLYGHSHSQNVFTKQNVTSDIYFTDVSRGLIVNNITNNDINYQNGYSIIDFDSTNSEIKLYLKVYSRDRNEFVNDTCTLGDKGVRTFELQKKQDELKELHYVSNKIYTSFIEGKMDDDLLSCGIDTIAPQKFKDLFVSPRLIDQKDSTPEKEKIVSEDYLIKNNGNYVVFGSKEIGKTVLLDYMVYFLIEHIDSMKKIPVFIDYSKKKRSTTIKTCISRFTGIDIAKVEAFCNKNKVVLLIDNYDYKDKVFSEELIDFLKNNENISFVITIKTEYSKSIPTEFFDNKLSDISRIFQLKYFNTKQITELTDRWYYANLPTDKNNKKDKIIKIITSLELPRTPLAISMFLWIFEKQENYRPVNQATLLENFIEKMFKKHNFEQSLYSEFDFKNKEKLLSAIALEMYRTNNTEYSLKYQELLEFISNYLKKREFDFKALDILNEFIKVNLLKTKNEHQDSIVSFRFNCFFQYFLMKNIDDEKFRSEVLSNYLSFIDEINLYTGIKRDCEDIFHIAITELESNFQEIEKIINGSYDSFFETKKSFTESLEENNVKMLENEKSKISKNIENTNDKLLEKAPVGDMVAKKKFNFTKIEKLERSLVLAANVLRNSEEIDKENVKYNSLVKVLHASHAYSCLCEHLLKNKYDTFSQDKKKEAQKLLYLLPLLNEFLLEDVLGTSKLNNVVKKHIDNIINDKNSTQLEKFCTIFLYSDFEGKDYFNVLKKYVKNLKGHYIRDMVLFKIASYYLMRSKTKESNLNYENLMATLIQSSNKNLNKSAFMQNCRKRKDEYIIENEDD